MKKLSRKWLILEHYVQTAVVMKGETTIRLWKPKTMGKLPAKGMKAMMLEYTQDYDYIQPIFGKAKWSRANPDFGYWDAQIAIYYDPHRKAVDIYICSLLVRPFSKEAQEHYEERMGFEPIDRLLLMWDSRQFDAEGNYPVAPNGGINFTGTSYTYDDLYRVINEKEDVEDTSK